MNYPILSLIFYEFGKNTVSKYFKSEIELTEQEKENILDKTIKYVQKELIKLKQRNHVPKKEGN